MNQESNKKHHDKNIERISAESMHPLRKLINHEKRARLVILLILLGILVGATLAKQTFQETVANSGSIKVVGVSLFWDKTLTNKVISITWGTITPGTSAKKYVYIRSDGTTNATLSMNYGNWTPAAAASYLKLTWNSSNYVLSRNAAICAMLTLSVQANITGVTGFSFAMLIQATG